MRPRVDHHDSVQVIGSSNSRLPTDLNESPIHRDAFVRFQSHAGIAWERADFDERPFHVTVSHDDPLTAEQEHAVSLRHHAQDGSEVFKRRVPPNSSVD